MGCEHHHFDEWFWYAVLVCSVCLFFFLFKTEKTHSPTIFEVNMTQQNGRRVEWIGTPRNQSAIRITKVYEIYQSIRTERKKRNDIVCENLFTDIIIYCLVLTSNFKLLAFKNLTKCEHLRYIRRPYKLCTYVFFCSYCFQ